jgi:Asp-tRNA(Asn)/Glu-tRNA(Gln) amidotransferase A subunit family amidase
VCVPDGKRMLEFAFGGTGLNSHHGAPYNPWDASTHRSPGGSSSGAGVSLLEGSALLAFGSDTAGSVRIPASMTGTVGLKVTLGRWSTEGVVPLSHSFDTPGLLARSVADAAYRFAVGARAADGSVGKRRLWRSATRDGKSNAGLRLRHNRIAGCGYCSAAEPSRRASQQTEPGRQLDRQRCALRGANRTAVWAFAYARGRRTGTAARRFTSLCPAPLLGAAQPT